MANINETIANVEKFDPELARQLRKYVRDHAYGLVFEHNLPEAVRLYTKRAVFGDTVNIRPARGKEEKEENKVAWNVKEINGDQATIENGQESKTVLLEDLVPIVSYREVIYPGLKEVDRIERGSKDDPYQVVINAENYHALEMLTYCYAGKVDCIYIDPPYNTGAKDWKYNNDYVDGNDQYRHSKWLAFMERRLKLAKQLLKPDVGVMVVAIDDYEYARLSLLIEQVFPEYDVNPVVVLHHPQGGSSDNISRTHEYALFVTPHGSKVIKGQKQEGFSDSWSLIRGGTDVRNRRVGRPNSFYAIYVDKNSGDVVGVGPHLDADDAYDINDAPDGCVAIYPIGKDGVERVWRYERESMRAHIEDGDIFCTKNRSLKVRKTKDVKYDAVFSVWTDGRYNAGTNGTDVIYNLFAKDSRFSYPKSLYTVRDCIAFATPDNPDALIVDFFAGSGTTLHAVNLLNAEDGGHRRCVCVTNNEVSVDEQKTFVKKGLRPGDDDWEAHGIARYVTWPRTKCSIKGVDVKGEPLKGNYIGSDGEKDSGQPMSEGFVANAIFFDLTYESAWPIRLDNAFDAIAPILWMQAGCKGPIIHRIGKSYLTTDYYGVLFDYGQASKFCEKVKRTPSIKTVYVVTDDQRRYSNICRRLPGVEVHRLYETFLKTFEICGEGGLD